jgi:hypothetical protein
MFAAPHHNKRIYLFETYPELYEYYSPGTPASGAEQSEAIKKNLMHAEKNAYSAPGTKVFAGSQLLCEDLRERFGITAELLYPPALQPKKLAVKGEDEKKDMLRQNQFFVTESILAPETNMLRLSGEFDRLKKPLAVFVPNANPAHFDAIQKETESKAKGKVILIRGHISDDIYEKTAGYLHFDKDARKIKGAVIRAVKNNVPVIYTEDCGGACSFLKNYKNALEINPNNFSDNINGAELKNKYEKYDNEAEIKEFAERLLRG